MKKNKHSFRSLLAIFLLVINSSCQPATTSPNNQQTDSTTSSNSEAQNIQVNIVSPQKTSGATEEFPLPNCGGTGKLSQSLGTQVSVSKKVEMGTTVSVSGGGEVGISAAAKLTLEAAIEAAYKQEYETANSRLDTISMEAAPKTHVIYTIEWEKEAFSSIMTFGLNGEMVQTPYTFTMNVPKIAGSREEKCPGNPPPTTPPPVDLQKTFFSLPNEGVPNNNGYIGPFCCTGRTVTVYTTGGSPIGYIYFYDFPGGGYNVSNGSAAANFSILISGITDLTNVLSPTQQSSIDFVAGEMRVGASRSARAGALDYIVTITQVDIETINAQPYYNMGTIAIRVDVSLLR